MRSLSNFSPSLRAKRGRVGRHPARIYSRWDRGSGTLWDCFGLNALAMTDKHW